MLHFVLSCKIPQEQGESLLKRRVLRDLHVLNIVSRDTRAHGCTDSKARTHIYAHVQCHVSHVRRTWPTMPPMLSTLPTVFL